MILSLLLSLHHLPSPRKKERKNKEKEEEKEEEEEEETVAEIGQFSILTYIIGGSMGTIAQYSHSMSSALLPSNSISFYGPRKELVHLCSTSCT